MAVELNTLVKSVVWLGLLGYSIHWFYRILHWMWLKPKRQERILREQGFKGNDYRLIQGDQRESTQLILDAMSKPIAFGEDIRKRIIPQMLKTVDTYGKNSYMWNGTIPLVFLSDPDLVREVLTKWYKFHKNLHDHDPITRILLTGLGMLEGEPWTVRRKLVKTAFYAEKLKSMQPAFYLSCREMMSKIDSGIPEGGAGEIDAWDHFRTLAGDVTSRVLFGISLNDGGKPIYDLLQELISFTMDILRQVYIPGWRFLPTKRNLRMREIDKELRVRIKELIKDKTKKMQAGEAAGDDLLGTLLECNADEMKASGQDRISIDDIIDECKLFFFAGQDTTASLLTWSLVFMSKYPEWQERAREEAFQILGDKPTNAFTEGLNRLKVLNMIMYEVLRLHPPIVEVSKVAAEDTQLGKYFIPEGTHLVMAQLLIHYDREFWGDDVFEFKPQRFAEGITKATQMQGAYIPFGLGPRMCIGQNLALGEAKSTLTTLLRTYTFELSPSYVHAPTLIINLVPQHGAYLKVRKLQK